MKHLSKTQKKILAIILIVALVILIPVVIDKINNSDNQSEQIKTFGQTRVPDTLLKVDSSRQLENLISDINEDWVCSERDESIDYYSYQVSKDTYLYFEITMTKNSCLSQSELESYFDNEAYIVLNKETNLSFSGSSGCNAIEYEYRYADDEDTYTHEIIISDATDTYFLSTYGYYDNKAQVDTLFFNIVNSIHVDTSHAITTTHEKTTKPTTITTTTESTTTENIKPTEITDNKTMIFSDEKVNIYFDSVEPGEYSKNKFTVYFYVKNKTDKQLEFQADTLTIDGFSYNDIIMSDPVAPKSTGIIEAKIYSKMNTATPETIGIGFRYFDENSNHYKANATGIKVK